MVPRFGIGTSQDLRQALARLAQDRLAIQVLQMASLGGEDYEADLSSLAEKIQREEMTSDKLYPAGTLIHVEGERAEVVNNKKFDQILLSDGMFSSHMPGCYMEACRRLAAGTAARM